MNINISRKKAIYEIYKRGESVETIMLLTGFSRTTIDNIIKGMPGETAFDARWSNVVNTLRRVSGRI